MNRKSLAIRYQGLLILGLLMLTLLGACSGGHFSVSVDGSVIPPIPPIQTSETITAHGTVSGVAGITVNDVRYSTNMATVTINGSLGHLSDLRRGQIVTVSGRLDSAGWSGIANSIVYDASVIGPVETLDAANQRLTVMGQSVRISPDTQFGSGIDPTTFSGLSIGGIVELTGYRDAGGELRATRIDRETTGAEQQLIGKASNLDLARLQFMINQMTVDYSSAIFIDLPGGAPANDMMLKATGTMSGGHLLAERLEQAPRLGGNSGQRVQVAGVITRFASLTDFDINSSTARARFGTIYVNGTAGDLGLNTEVVIDGYFASDGRITADRVTYGHDVNAVANLNYDFADFTEIFVPTVFHVTVVQGPEFSVDVVIDSEDAHRVDVTQTGQRLNIALLPGDGDIATLEAFVTMPALNGMELTGVVSATLSDFDQSHMTLHVGGVSTLRAYGIRLDSLDATVSGVSQLDFRDTRPIANASIDVSGVSQATLNMDIGSAITGSVLTGQGTGTSKLYYYGTNVAVNVTTDSSSSVIKLGETRP